MQPEIKTGGNPIANRTQAWVRLKRTDRGDAMAKVQVTRLSRTWYHWIRRSCGSWVRPVAKCRRSCSAAKTSLVIILVSNQLLYIDIVLSMNHRVISNPSSLINKMSSPRVKSAAMQSIDSLSTWTPCWPFAVKHCGGHPQTWASRSQSSVQAFGLIMHWAKMDFG